MYTIVPGILANPLQVETIEFHRSELLINKQQTGTYAVIKMASGAKFEVDSSMCDNVDEAMEKLVYQIDIANGMDFTKKAEGDANEQTD